MYKFYKQESNVIFCYVFYKLLKHYRNVAVDQLKLISRPGSPRSSMLIHLLLSRLHFVPHLTQIAVYVCVQEIFPALLFVCQSDGM